MFRYPEESLRCKSQGERFSWCCVSKNPVALKLATCPGLCMGIYRVFPDCPARAQLLTRPSWMKTPSLQAKCLSFLGPLRQTLQSGRLEQQCVASHFVEARVSRHVFLPGLVSPALLVPLPCHGVPAMSSCGPPSACPHPCLFPYEDTSLMGMWGLTLLTSLPSSPPLRSQLLMPHQRLELHVRIFKGTVWSVGQPVRTWSGFSSENSLDMFSSNSHVSLKCWRKSGPPLETWNGTCLRGSLHAWDKWENLELSLLLGLTDLGGRSPRGSSVASPQPRWAPLLRAGNPAGLEAEQKPCASPESSVRDSESAPPPWIQVKPHP